MKHLLQYGVYDETDSDILVFIGTIQEVAAFLGVTVSAVSHGLKRGSLFVKKYRVEEVENE